jgi:hypothetical protein
MPSSKLARMVVALKARTDRGDIEWKFSGEENSFKVELTNYTVSIYVQYNFEGTEDVWMRIYAKDGSIIESFNDTNLSSSDIPGSESPYAYMSSLHQSARRIAFGVDKAIDEIISDIEDIF